MARANNLSMKIQRHLDIANTLLSIPREEKVKYEISKSGKSNQRYHGFAPQSYRKSTIYEDNVDVSGQLDLSLLSHRVASSHTANNLSTTTFHDFPPKLAMNTSV